MFVKIYQSVISPYAAEMGSTLMLLTSPVGGGNAPNANLPTEIKHLQKKQHYYCSSSGSILYLWWDEMMKHFSFFQFMDETE